MTLVSPHASRGSSPLLSVLPSALDRSLPLPVRSATSSGPASETIGERLHAYEELLRAAHVANLELSLDLRRVQAEQGLTAITGHQLFAKLDEAQVQVSSAITSAAAGHRLARQLAPIAGIDPAAYGETTDPAAAIEAPLRSVA